MLGCRLSVAAACLCATAATAQTVPSFDPRSIDAGVRAAIAVGSDFDEFDATVAECMETAMRMDRGLMQRNQYAMTVCAAFELSIGHLAGQDNSPEFTPAKNETTRRVQQYLLVIGVAATNLKQAVEVLRQQVASRLRTVSH